VVTLADDDWLVVIDGDWLNRTHNDPSGQWKFFNPDYLYCE